MQVLYAHEGVPPFVDIFVFERDCIYSVLFHQGVSRFFNSMHVKLFFQERIDSRIQTKRETRRSADTQTPIEIKTLRTLEKKVHLRAAQLKWFFAAGFIHTLSLFGIVIL